MLIKDRFPARVAQLLGGLCLYGLSMAMLVRADLGLDPWDVLTQGVAPRIGVSFGLTVNLIGLLILVLWLPLRQKPGLGTVLNIMIIGTVTDLALALIPTQHEFRARATLLVLGILFNGIAGGAYIGAGLGAGPRDGLMTGICKRTGLSIKGVRTVIEVTVLAIGWMLGGTVGIGTLLYAISIGWLVHHALPRFSFKPSIPKDAT